MRLDIAGLTDIGRKKDRNEDNYGIFGEDSEGKNLFLEGALVAVADGLGGHTGGEIASKLAVSMVRDLLKEDPPSSPPRNPDVVLDAASMGYLPQIRAAMMRANDSIYQTNRDLVQHGRPMGTTLLTAMIEPKVAWLANVGDSRAYHFRDGEIIARTEDHSWVDEQVKQGLMTREEAESDRRKNLVTRSIGTHPAIEADSYRWSLVPGDILLLCTDGLVNMVKDAAITEIVNQPLLAEDIAKALVDKANENGGKDNITVVVAIIDPDPKRIKYLRAKAFFRNKGISLKKILCLGGYGLACFVLGYLARMIF